MLEGKSEALTLRLSGGFLYSVTGVSRGAEGNDVASIQSKASLNGTKQNTGWKPMLYYAAASSLQVHGDR
jgi:hypothetical protein